MVVDDPRRAMNVVDLAKVRFGKDDNQADIDNESQKCSRRTGEARHSVGKLHIPRRRCDSEFIFREPQVVAMFPKEISKWLALPEVV